EAEFQFALDRAASAATATWEKDRMDSFLQNAHRIILQQSLIDAIRFLAIDGVGTQVRHEEAQHRVRKKIQARAVSERRQAHEINHVTNENAVDITLVGRNENNRSSFGQAFQMTDFPFH